MDEEKDKSEQEDDSEVGSEVLHSCGDVQLIEHTDEEGEALFQLSLFSKGLDIFLSSEELIHIVSIAEDIKGYLDMDSEDLTPDNQIEDDDSSKERSH